MRIIKKMDIVIIAVLLILSFTPHLIFFKTSQKGSKNNYAIIKVDGKIHKKIDLSKVKKSEKVNLNLPNGKNTLLVENNSIEMKSANCNDALCVKQGNISKVGQTIICLPHKLIIEIKGDELDSKDDLILSH